MFYKLKFECKIFHVYELYEASWIRLAAVAHVLQYKLYRADGFNTAKQNKIREKVV